MKALYRLVAGGLVVIVGAALLFLFRAQALPPASGRYGIGREPLDLTARQGTDATPIAELWFPIGADGPRPVLVYFPSWTGTEIENGFLIRDLVSHGFVVATLRYPTAREIAAAPEERRGEPPDAMVFSSQEAFDRTLSVGDAKVRARARDAAALLNRLERLDREPTGALAGRFDLDRIGIWGFSLGGAAAAEAAWLDPRFKAVVNLDGWLFADVAQHGVAQSYLFMSDATPLPQPAELTSPDPVVRYTAILDQGDYDREIAGLKRHGGYMLTIDGTAHINFADAAARSRFRRLTGGGPLNAIRALTIVATYLRGFFETQLLGTPSSLFTDAPPPFAEAHLQAWPGDAH